MALNHKGKIALITGANKGIGLEVARQLGVQGVTVFRGRSGKLNTGISGGSRLIWPKMA
jgi:NAD(P)-dependent dehydrogenase (short-subunit alcohol dehydrogenase family)